MFFEASLEGYTKLTYLRFSTRAGDLVNPWAQHRVIFIFNTSKEFFKGFIRFERHLDILLSQEF